MVNKRIILKGVYWNGLQMIVNQGASFLIRLVLARILFPEEFGIVGMATVVIGFVQMLNDLGIAAALVQRKESELRDEHYHTAFWTGVSWSALLYLTLSLFAAPLIADFYQQDVLQTLIPVLSLGILINPVNLVHNAILTKRMDFKKLAFINNSSNLLSGAISIILAFLGAGVWALVFNYVAMVVFTAPLYFFATRWKPKLIWSSAAFKDVFGFGIYTTGTNIVNYLINNIDFLFIGKLMSAQVLGAYTFAFVLTDMFRGRMMAVINNVMYPVYGRLQDDPSSLRKYYLQVIEYNSVLVFPVMIFLIVLGEPFVLVFFGEKWSDSIEVLKILSLAVMVHMLVNSNTALIRGMGKPRLELILQCVKGVIFIPILIVAIKFFGIVGAAYAVLINKVIAVMIAQFTFNQLLSIRLTLRDFFYSIKVPLGASFFACLASYLVYNVLNIGFFISATVLVLIYGMYIWCFMRGKIQEEINNIKNKARYNEK